MAVAQKRTFEEMMAVEAAEDKAALDATMEAVHTLADPSKERQVDMSIMIELVERHRAAFAQTGCQCRLPLYTSAFRINYNCRLWPAVVVKHFLQVHACNYASILLANKRYAGKTTDDLDALSCGDFRENFLAIWNKKHPNNVAHWETHADGRIDLIIA